MTDDEVHAAAELLRGWMESTGPQTQSALARRFALADGVMEAALLQIEAEGQILRGRFTAAAMAEATARIYESYL